MAELGRLRKTSQIGDVVRNHAKSHAYLYYLKSVAIRGFTKVSLKSHEISQSIMKSKNGAVVMLISLWSSNHPSHALKNHVHDARQNADRTRRIEFMLYLTNISQLP